MSAVPKSQRRPSRRGAALLGRICALLEQEGLLVAGAEAGRRVLGEGCAGHVAIDAAHATEVIATLARQRLWAVQLVDETRGALLQVVDAEGVFAQHVAIHLRPAGEDMRSGWARGWQRWRYPLGVSVALLGPDGTGKSTIAAACCARLRHLFQSTAVQHLRPSLLPELQRLMSPRKWGSPRAKVDATDPHGKPAAGTLSSLVRLAYYSGDYLLGYLPRLRYPTSRGQLLMFDRYHADLLADPLRWRIGLPEAPRSLATRALPLPDLVVLLDGPADVLHARKAELPPAEIARQSTVYRRLVGGLANGHVVSVEASPDEVATSVCQLIARRQASMVRRRMQLVSVGGDS